MLLQGTNIYLRALEEADAAAYTDLLVRNRHVWKQFEPAKDEDFYQVEHQRELILESQEDTKNGKSYHFGIFLNNTDLLAGDISLYSVKTSFFQSAQAGYALDTDQTGKGLASEALFLLMKFAFNIINLRRLEAGVSPDNPASIRVLEKAGFRREGLMRENLLINGEWKSHFLYAVLSKDIFRG
ncbi:GNAT family N-acetyltransferase [Peribacillus deserti]|nr:GNAT family protein [Peribacillus deserti]